MTPLIFGVLFHLVSFFEFLIQFLNFIFIKSNRIIDAFCLQLMNVANWFIGTVGTIFAFWIIITFIDL